MTTSNGTPKEAPQIRKRTKVSLVPWDPESEEQVERLFQQRESCRWKSERVQKWRGLQREGKMAIHWIVLDPSDPATEAGLALHNTTYPLEATPITDTAASIYGKPREAPSLVKFSAIGHISLDDFNPGSPDLDRPGERYWITTLYVSRALHGMGLGSSAMDAVEETARTQLMAHDVGLDTMWKGMLEDKERILSSWGSESMGDIVNQDWYDRRGYKVILVQKNGYMAPGIEGKLYPVDLVYMVKDLK